MDIKSIEIKDTNGILSENIWKTTINEPSIVAYFTKSDNRKMVLNIAPGNVNFITTGGDNDKGLTYKTYLMYNGTLSTKDRVFKTQLSEESGVLVRSSPPITTYSPDGVMKPTFDEMQDEVIQLDIKMYTGVADVLEYKDGALTRGGKVYNTKMVHNYPMIITEMPNIERDVVFLDGWYTYTFIMFRDVVNGKTRVEEGLYYSFEGKVFKASKSGLVAITEGGDIYIVDATTVLDDSDTFVTFKSAVKQDDSGNYMDLRLQMDSRDGVGDNYNHSYVESQLLITDELRDAITREIMCAAAVDDTGCDFADWQRLTLKRQAAVIMFWNELYRNSQVLIESSRKMCHYKYDDEC